MRRGGVPSEHSPIDLLIVHFKTCLATLQPFNISVRIAPNQLQLQSKMRKTWKGTSNLREQCKLWCHMRLLRTQKRAWPDWCSDFYHLLLIVTHLFHDLLLTTPQPWMHRLEGGYVERTTPWFQMCLVASLGTADKIPFTGTVASPAGLMPFSGPVQLSLCNDSSPVSPPSS